LESPLQPRSNRPHSTQAALAGFDHSGDSRNPQAGGARYSPPSGQSALHTLSGRRICRAHLRRPRQLAGGNVLGDLKSRIRFARWFGTAGAALDPAGIANEEVIDTMPRQQTAESARGCGGFGQ